MILKQVTRENIFIPNFNGNRSLPIEDQISVQIKHWPSVTEIGVYKSFSFDSKQSIELKYNDAPLLNNCVGRILNLKVGTEDIKNGSDLSQSTCKELVLLVTEIRDYIFNDGELISVGESKA